jgi:hypothetical protein
VNSTPLIAKIVRRDDVDIMQQDIDESANQFGLLIGDSGISQSLQDRAMR